MAAQLYTRLSATVNRLIVAYGQQIIYKSVAAPVSDAAQPWKTTAGTYTLQPIFMAFVDAKNYKQFLQFIKGSDIPEGGKIGLMAAQSFTPSKLDTVYRDMLGYAVEGYKVVDPGGVPLLYKIELARSGSTSGVTADVIAMLQTLATQTAEVVNVDMGAI